MTSPWADWITREMNRRGWRAADAARAFGVDNSMISKWARGKQVPDIKSLRGIAERLGLPLLAVLVGAGVLTADEAEEKPLAELNAEDLDTTDLVAEVKRRFEVYESELDSLRESQFATDDHQERAVGLDVPGVPIRRPRTDGIRHLK